MLFVKFQGTLPVEVSSSIHGGEGWQNRNDWKSYDQVVSIASYLTAMTGKQYLGVDAGSGVSPRFDVIEAPNVNDPISYGFNGDYHPDGFIARITPNWMVISTSGAKYNRRGNSGSWVKVGGTWSMVPGHLNERNPSF